jgi:hypothetical protein
MNKKDGDKPMERTAMRRPINTYFRLFGDLGCDVLACSISKDALAMIQSCFSVNGKQFVDQFRAKNSVHDRKATPAHDIMINAM